MCCDFQVLDTLEAARDMDAALRSASVCLASTSRVLSSRIGTVESVMEWVQELDQWAEGLTLASVSYRHLAHTYDSSFAVGLGRNGGTAWATFSLNIGRVGYLRFERVCTVWCSR